VSSKVLVAVRVAADPLRSFEAFTREIALWWRPSGLFQITAGGDGTLAFDPGVGGRLYTRFSDGREFEIGRISVWEPGRRLVFAWRQASFASDQSTEVEVRFEAVGAQTRVSVQHSAWDSIPQRHAARHGFPEPATLTHVAAWWRTSLQALQQHLTS
jgi:uncharacterized protein YndB with AHSA1/START domain